MQCNLSCKCGQVKGKARLMFDDSMPKPRLAYGEIAGFFTVGDGRDKEMLICPQCHMPAMTKGDWESL